MTAKACKQTLAHFMVTIHSANTKCATTTGQELDWALGK